jgi:tryptophan-rich sensory protein
LFFQFHAITMSFASIIIMIITTFLIIIFSHKKINYVPALLTPYILWLVFAAYLNFFVLYYN